MGLIRVEKGLMEMEEKVGSEQHLRNSADLNEHRVKKNMEIEERCGIGDVKYERSQ